MEKKFIDAQYYFDLEVEDDTPDYVIQELFDRALEEIAEEFDNMIRSRKMKTSFSGSLSYNALGDDEDEAYQSMKDSKNENN